ncbi:MAG: pitrilysin family protein [Alphaproteobacteria bacterium]
MTIKITTLPDGLRVVSDAISTVETIAVGAWIKVGSRYETIETNGAAHFLEHMAFKGTKTRSAFEISKAIESVGGYLNAYTSRETTAYYARSLKEHLPIAIELLADILQNSVFDPAEMEKERTVILQEIAQTNDTPDDIIFDHMQNTAFPNQSFGRSILGPADLIQQMKRETLMDFMASHYSPENMVIAATGNLDHDKLVGLVGAHFNCLPSHKPATSESAVYKGGVFQEHRPLEQLHVVLGFLGRSFKEDYYGASLYSSILGGGMSSRLFQEVREKRGLAYSISAHSSSFSDTGLINIYAGTSPKEAEPLMEVIQKEMKKLPKTITDEEILSGKNQFKSGLLMSLESTSARAKSIAQQMLIFNRVKTIPEIINHIDSIQKEDLVEFGVQLVNSPMTLATIGSTSVKVPVSF